MLGCYCLMAAYYMYNNKTAGKTNVIKNNDNFSATSFLKTCLATSDILVVTGVKNKENLSF